MLGVLLVVAGPGSLRGQENYFLLDEVTQSVQDWMGENVDEGVLEVLGELDEEQVRELLGEVMRRLQGYELYDLRPLREAAASWVPLLREHEETAPYAAWLEVRLEDMQVVEEMWRRMQVPSMESGVKMPVPQPPLTVQRRVWADRVARRPVPARAEGYVKRLKPVLARSGVPSQLVWLAEVESSFNPQAMSPVGARGLFQLMPKTAKGLGLSLSPRDERLDPEKSARAAGAYLRYLHSRFRDWPLALAAYNAGPTRVDRLLARSGQRSFAAIASELPVETQLYVPKVEAILKRREGVTLVEL